VSKPRVSKTLLDGTSSKVVDDARAAQRSVAAGTEVVASLGGGAPFSRTALWAIAGVVLASLVAMFALLIASDDVEIEPSNGADGYSASAIGHRGLIKVLRELGVPVVVSQSGSAAKAKGGLLVIAEPVISDEDSAKRFRETVRGAETVLVVLPKWWTTSSSEHPEWASYVDLVPTTDVTAVLAELGLDAATVHRGDAAYKPAPALLEAAPGELPDVTLPHSPQTIGDTYLESGMALVDNADGTYFYGTTTLGSTEVAILTDPDALNNAGLDEGKNARFAVMLIDRLRAGGPVVFDEIAHGYALEPSIWRLMFQWPLVLATLQSLICILVLVAATAGRFGPARLSIRPYAAGKDFLIRNTASLLRYGGHDGEALRRYLLSTVQSVRAILHAPRDLTMPQMHAWLERIRIARNGTIALPDLERDVAAATVDPALAKRIPELAMRIHRWRQEMTHGSGHHP
jgi:hypothetical protein